MSEAADRTAGPAAEVKRLRDMLQYQEGSIVSRVLLKNKGGTATFFAFDTGEGLSEHTAPFDTRSWWSRRARPKSQSQANCSTFAKERPSQCPRACRMPSGPRSGSKCCL